MVQLPAEDKGMNRSAQGCEGRSDFYVALEGRRGWRHDRWQGGNGEPTQQGGHYCHRNCGGRLAPDWHSLVVGLCGRVLKGDFLAFAPGDVVHGKVQSHDSDYDEDDVDEAVERCGCGQERQGES